MDMLAWLWEYIVEAFDHIFKQKTFIVKVSGSAYRNDDILTIFS